MTVTVPAEPLAEPSPEALVDDLATTRERLRGQARAQLGVTGEQTTERFRDLRREYGFSYYPLFALWILLFVDGFQLYAFGVLAPDISRALGVSIGAIAAAVSLDTLAVSIAPLPIAWLSQRGRRAMLCVSTAVVWSVLTLFTGFVVSMVGLVLILLVDGLTTGSVTALHAPLVMDSHPPRARVRAMSIYFSAFYFGNVGAPLIVALFSGIVGLTWRGIFLSMGGISVLLTLLTIGLRDPGYGKWDSDRVRGTVHQAHDDAAASAGIGGTELGFWEVCRRLLLIPTLRRIFFATLLLGVLSVPLNTFISFFLQQRWNFDATQRGLFFAFYAACSMGSLYLYGNRGERRFRRNPAGVAVLCGSLLALVVVFIAVGGEMPSLAGMLVCFGIGGALIGPLTPSLYVLALSVIPASMRPHSQALAGIFLAGGGALGSLFFSGFETRVGISGALVAVAIPGAIGALVIASAGRHVSHDMDRMIDEIVEDEEIQRLRASGRHLPLLTCRSVDFSYGSLQVLFKVDFSVDDGEMVALLGVNGAGKSTLLKVISGVGLPTGGSVRFGGQDITFLDAERRLRLGIVQIPGGRAVFAPLTVVDNLRAFGYTVGRDRRRLDRAIERCFEAFPRLAERRNSLAASLSGGEQQMLGLSKALILQPRLLLIDELSLGLAPVIVGQLLDMVRRINAEGTAVVLVEQSVNIALNLVEHAYFMEKGEIRFDGRAADLLARDDLLRAVFLQGAGAAG
jgi:ABC-type branched-subunit amino acid transport system ATPase component/predicted MFS family arabinose efflux permease